MRSWESAPRIPACRASGCFRAVVGMSSGRGRPAMLDEGVNEAVAGERRRRDPDGKQVMQRPRAASASTPGNDGMRDRDSCRRGWRVARDRIRWWQDLRRISFRADVDPSANSRRIDALALTAAPRSPAAPRTAPGRLPRRSALLRSARVPSSARVSGSTQSPPPMRSARGSAITRVYWPLTWTSTGVPSGSGCSSDSRFCTRVTVRPSSICRTYSMPSRLFICFCARYPTPAPSTPPITATKPEPLNARADPLAPSAPPASGPIAPAGIGPTALESPVTFTKREDTTEACVVSMVRPTSPASYVVPDG